MGLLGEMITLRKKDGRSLGGIKASVHGAMIVFNETQPPPEVGDTIILGRAGGPALTFLVLEVEHEVREVGRRRGRGRRYHARVASVKR